MSGIPSFGDTYRGGYSTSGGSFITDELREASSTFANYISGTIYLTFLIFLAFMLLSLMTLTLMGYARLVTYSWVGRRALKAVSNSKKQCPNLIVNPNNQWNLESYF